MGGKGGYSIKKVKLLSILMLVEMPYRIEAPTNSSKKFICFYEFLELVVHIILISE